MLDKPQRLYSLTVSRRRYVRRVFWNLLAAVAAFGAWAALDAARTLAAGQVDPLLLRVGGVVALGVTALFAVRLVFNLLRALRRREETAHFFDQGFTWQVGRQEPRKYAWTQVKHYREGVRALRLGPLRLGQIGAHTLTTRDNTVYRVTAAHGNPAEFMRAVRPYLADALGTRMGQALRERKSIRIHPQLVVAAQGVVAGKDKLRWSELDVAVKRGRLHIRRVAENGKFTPVRSYPIHQIDNLGGFLEVANITIRNHQPERFNIKTQGQPRRR